LTASLRFVVALLAALLFIAGPLTPLGWVAGQSRDFGVCMQTPPDAPGPTSSGAEIIASAGWWPPRVTCTFRLRDEVVVVRHDAPHRDLAAPLMAMGLVLAIAAYAAPSRRRDEAAPSHG
jgi:hypothetical protein